MGLVHFSIVEVIPGMDHHPVPEGNRFAGAGKVLLLKVLLLKTKGLRLPKPGRLLQPPIMLPWCRKAKPW